MDQYARRCVELTQMAHNLARLGFTREAIKASRLAELVEKAALAEDRLR